VSNGEPDRISFPGGWSFWGYSGGINGPSAFGSAYAKDGQAHVFLQAGYTNVGIESAVRSRYLSAIGYGIAARLRLLTSALLARSIKSCSN
jgi:hypothetical protein